MGDSDAYAPVPKSGRREHVMKWLSEVLGSKFDILSEKDVDFLIGYVRLCMKTGVYLWFSQGSVGTDYFYNKGHDLAYSVQDIVL